MPPAPPASLAGPPMGAIPIGCAEASWLLGPFGMLPAESSRDGGLAPAMGRLDTARGGLRCMFNWFIQSAIRISQTVFWISFEP